MFIWVLAMLFTYLSVICFQLCYYDVCVGTECQEAGKTDDKVASGYQFRHRRILSNASADGTECPALSQLRRCHTDWGDACSRWEVQPLLDTCHLADNATCGLGYHELVFRCRRYDGVRVSLLFIFFPPSKRSRSHSAQLFAYYINYIVIVCPFRVGKKSGRKVTNVSEDVGRFLFNDFIDANVAVFLRHVLSLTASLHHRSSVCGRVSLQRK